MSLFVEVLSVLVSIPIVKLESTTIQAAGPAKIPLQYICARDMIPILMVFADASPYG